MCSGIIGERSDDRDGVSSCNVKKFDHLGIGVFLRFFWDVTGYLDKLFSLASSFCSMIDSCPFKL